LFVAQLNGTNGDVFASRDGGLISRARVGALNDDVVLPRIDAVDVDLGLKIGGGAVMAGLKGNSL